uniref:Cathelicidin antimicrobial peptide C-terminal domain-containing protein n=1 Tax=Geobacter sp. (strain M21) TaxID=443144 RepID=C6DYB5_GEOSM
MKMSKIGLVALLICSVAAGVSGCKKEGPAERAGKEIDRSVEKAGKEFEKAGNKIDNIIKEINK